MKKVSIMLSFLILSVSFSLGQSNNNLLSGNNTDSTDYYYYKGKKVPLIANADKICVSIPKDSKKISERIIANVQILNTIGDKSFDIFVISQSDLKKLTLFDFWKEDAKSVLISPSFFTTSKEEVFTTPYLTVRLKKKEDIDILNSYTEKYRLKIAENSPLMPLWYSLSITKDCDKNALECANELWESGMFAASVPDFAVDNLLCSNDPLFNQQWGLSNSSTIGVDISASAAWNYATGNGVKIAIIDRGIDMCHVDLAPNIIDSLSYDTDNNVSPSQVTGAVTAHGTHCAGIAAAVKDNGIHIAGVAPDAKIIPISNCLITIAQTPFNLAKGIVWAYQHGADIISNSWHYSPGHPEIEEAIQDAFKYGRNGKGCIITFAVGNDSTNQISFPANCNDTILAVGAIDSIGMRAGYSNYGAGLDIVAPGDHIISTLPGDQTGYNSGTSMACPHVAGVAALILERNPELTVTQVNSIICSSAKKLSGVNFNVTKPYGTWNNEYGYGLVDAYSAVTNTPSLTYIQNETITGTRIISSDNIYVGRDVTDRKEYGDVILGQGNITLKADFIEIRNSTTVPLGTTLTIEN